MSLTPFIFPGDGISTTTYRDWNTTRTVTPLTDYTEYKVTFTQSGITEAATDTGNDVIYGGAGDDWIFGGGAANNEEWRMAA